VKHGKKQAGQEYQDNRRMEGYLPVVPQNGRKAALGKDFRGKRQAQGLQTVRRGVSV